VSVVGGSVSGASSVERACLVLSCRWVGGSVIMGDEKVEKKSATHRAVVMCLHVCVRCLDASMLTG
jgi:hypothetical protein